LLEPTVGPIRVSLADARPTVPEVEPEEGPSTAEQAVPWLIGVILLLAGMVIVLLALIFVGDAPLSLGGAQPSAAALAVAPSAASTTEPTPSATPAPSASAAVAVAEPTPTPMVLPEYGPLEMIYQGRSAALAPIYLLHDDFTTADAPGVLAQDATLDVRRFAWTPDGSVGAGLLADVLVSIEFGAEKRPLGSGISTITFGDDASTVYAVRVTEDGTNDVATVLAIDFVTGNTRELASQSYPRPAAEEREAVDNAQAADDGGPVRLYWLESNTLRLWVIGAGMWDIAPADGAVAPIDPATAAPVLWSPDGERHIDVTLEGTVSTLTVLDEDAAVVMSTTVEGRVSHLRWSPGGERVVFTLGTTAPNGGVIQDLFLWDVENNPDNKPPMKLTTTGANFGAEWRGSQPLWRH
jgi:hypothetical protein